MADEKLSLEQIVTQAVEGAPAELEKQGIKLEESQKRDETTKVIPIDTKKPEEKKVEEKPEEKKVDDVTTKEALELLSALRDPTKAPLVIKYLAEQAGYSKAPETEKQAEKQAKALTTKLKEALGADLEYIADKIGPILEVHLTESLEASQQETKRGLQALELKQYERTTALTIDQLTKQYFSDGKLPDNLASQMSKLADDIPMRTNQPLAEYLENLLFVAAGKTSTSLLKTQTSQQSQQNKDKLDKNRTDAAARLASDTRSSSHVADSLPSHKPTKMTLDESVRAAVEAARVQYSK